MSYLFDEKSFVCFIVILYQCSYFVSALHVCPSSIGKEHALVVQFPEIMNRGRNAGPRSANWKR